MEAILKNTHDKMEKGLAAVKQEMASIRTGRASLSILDEVKVDYYGTPTPLNQVATLNTPDPKLITIQPWEARIIPDIEKAIQKSGVGLTPSNDGKLIRLPIPNLTEERRKELVKLAKKYAEEGKVALRLVRRDANEEVKKKHEAKEISDDDFKRVQNQIQKFTDDFSLKIDQLLSHKEKDILSV